MVPVLYRFGGLLASNDVRALIAHQLGVDVKRVTDEAHFADDLGADWLDRLKLMIVIEDRFADVVIADEDVDQLEVVGDLIRHIETVDNERRRPSTSGRRSSDPQVMIAFSSRAVEPAEQHDRCEQLGCARGRRHMRGRPFKFTRAEAGGLRATFGIAVWLIPNEHTTRQPN
jgi:acyl carrier protein